MLDKGGLLSGILAQTASIVYACSIAALVGMVGYFAKIQGNRGRFRWQHLLLSVGLGGLNGYFVFLICNEAHWSWQVTAILTGASGALGNELLIILAGWVRRTVNVQSD